MNYYDAPQIVRNFLNYTETIAGKSENTVKEYYYDLRTFLRFLKCIRGLSDFENFDEISISDVNIDLIKSVTLDDLYDFMMYVGKTRENNQKTRARKVSCLKSFFKFLQSKAKLIENNPAKELEAPKIPKSLPRYLTLEDSLKLLGAVEGEFQARDYAILTLFLNCGLRLSELVGINLSDLKNDTLTVIGKGNKERTIYLNEACKNALNEYLKVRPHDGVKERNALFLSRNKTRLSAKMVQIIVKKNLARAGLDTSKYSAHKLRHTAATLMYKYGNVDIRALQEILGHKQLSTTEIYTHVDSEQLRKAVESNPLANVEKKK